MVRERVLLDHATGGKRLMTAIAPRMKVTAIERFTILNPRDSAKPTEKFYPSDAATQVERVVRA